MDKDYWQFSTSGCQTLFGNAFRTKQMEVQSYGNVLSSIDFLSELSRQELARKELNTWDSLSQLLISIRAIKQS